MLINSKHNVVLRFRPSFAAGINQLSCPRVAAGFTGCNKDKVSNLVSSRLVAYFLGVLVFI